MTEPNDKLVEELAEASHGLSCSQDGYTMRAYLADYILPIHTRDTLAAYQRGLRDAAAICDEVANGFDRTPEEYSVQLAAQRIRERLP